MAAATVSEKTEEFKETRGEIEKVNRETGEEEYGSEDEYDSESDSDEEIQEAGEPQYLTSKDQQLLYLSNQNCYYHIVELRRMRDAEMTVMVNYVRSLHALLLSVAVLALPTAASFVVSYALDSFINFRQAKLYKNYAMIVVNVILWMYGLTMLVLSVRAYNSSNHCLRKLAVSWAQRGSRVVLEAPKEQTQPKPEDEEPAGDEKEDEQVTPTTTASLTPEETVRKRDVLKEVSATKPDVSGGAGDVGLVESERPAASTVEPTVKDKRE